MYHNFVCVFCPVFALRVPLVLVKGLGLMLEKHK